jgi:ATP-dependent RNA helicase DDX49/DBP8
MTFKDLKLSQWLINNLQQVGIEKPTTIQRESLRHTLTGKNLIGCAHTGSGKTACFAIPVLEKLAKDPFGIFALVLTPTRELAY